MEIFLDSAQVEQVEKAMDLGWVKGVTTNPTLIARTNQHPAKVIKEICSLVQGPVSVEVFGTAYSDMVREASQIRDLSDHAVIKLPATLEGLKACAFLSRKEIPVNLTLCFSPAQALLAGASGATYVSPFWGRLDDNGQGGQELLATILRIYQAHPQWKTKVLGASLRNPRQIVACAQMGVHAVTAPWSVLKQMASHPLTQEGLSGFQSSAETIFEKTESPWT